MAAAFFIAKNIEADRIASTRLVLAYLGMHD